jgi:hypothetical protein
MIEEYFLYWAIKMTIRLSTSGFADLGLDKHDAIQKALSYDIDGIELCFGYAKDLLEFDPEDWLIAFMALFKNSIHMPGIDFTYKNDEFTKKIINKANEVMEEINVDYAVFHPTNIKDYSSLDLNTKIAVENLHEKDDRYSSFETIKSLLNEHTDVYLNVDTNHIEKVNGDPSEYLELKDRIIALHTGCQWTRKNDNKEKSHGFLTEATKEQLQSFEPLLKLGKPLTIEADIYSNKVSMIEKEIKFLRQFE